MPSGRRGPLVRVYATTTLDGDAAIASQFEAYRQLKLSSSSFSSSTTVFSNVTIVGFLSSKIAKASVDRDAEDGNTRTTLSCVSLTDRYLPAFRRLQLREAGGADDVGWEEVKVAVMTRAEKAGLPLRSKGKCV